jgi:hypothetical protein
MECPLQVRNRSAHGRQAHAMLSPNGGKNVQFSEIAKRKYVVDAIGHWKYRPKFALA